jgi:hypothetical protein
MHGTEMPTMQRTDLRAFERNHYFYGMLLDVYHFERETNYFNAKRRLLNRLVSGYGVVCGLDVEPGPEPNQIVVTPGVAIDKWGYEIIIPKKTNPITIPADLMGRVAGSYTQQKAEEETGVHVLICYHECESDPSPVLAGDCYSTQVCAPSTTREQYKIVFKAGFAPPIVLECRFPDVIFGKRLDYPTLARWVSTACPELPEDPCIPLANIRIEADQGHRCDPQNIDITIRPIVYANDILLDLLLSLLIEPGEQRRGK